MNQVALSALVPMHVITSVLRGAVHTCSHQGIEQGSRSQGVKGVVRPSLHCGRSYGGRLCGSGSACGRAAPPVQAEALLPAQPPCVQEPQRAGLERRSWQSSGALYASGCHGLMGGSHLA